jgi:hypothetical protein
MHTLPGQANDLLEISSPRRYAGRRASQYLIELTVVNQPDQGRARSCGSNIARIRCFVPSVA